MNFYPIAKAIPSGAGWRPTFVMFVGGREQCVPNEKSYSTPQEAKAAAKRYLVGLINPPVVGEQITVARELTEIEEWRERKNAEAEAERQRLFGDRVVKTKSGRVVEVAKVGRP